MLFLKTQQYSQSTCSEEHLQTAASENVFVYKNYSQRDLTLH